MRRLAPLLFAGFMGLLLIAARPFKETTQVFEAPFFKPALGSVHLD